MDKAENFIVKAENFRDKFIILTKRLLEFCRKTYIVKDVNEARMRIDAAQKMWEELSKHIVEGSDIIIESLEFFTKLDNEVQDLYFRMMAHTQRWINGTHTNDEMDKQKQKSLTEASKADEEFEAKTLVLSKRLLAFLGRKLERSHDRFDAKVKVDIAQKMWNEWTQHLARGSLIISKKQQFYANIEKNVEDKYISTMANYLRKMEAIK